MDLEQKQSALKKIFWDYNYSGEELYTVLTGERKDITITPQRIFLRMLERLSWYEITGISGLENVKILLTKETISALRIPEQKEKFEFIRKVLHGEPVSFTGWGDEYYQKIKHTLFPDRWNRTKQALL